VSFLHGHNLESDPLFKGAKGNKYNMADLKPKFEVEDYEGGLMIAARRNAEDEQHYWRITPWLMPFFTMVPPRGDYPVHGHFWVPIDDKNCWAWSFDYKPNRPLTDQEREAMEQGAGIHCAYIPGTYTPKANRANDYLMDREAQKQGLTYSGIEGIAIQDSSLQESMASIDPETGERVAWGGICDRTYEMLAPTDKGIMMARRKIFNAIEALENYGELPEGVDPEHHKVRSVSVLLPKDQKFLDGAKEAVRVKQDEPHTSV
jgi:hypothetical protein